MSKTRRSMRLNGERKKYSHYVWHAHTGHWPEWPHEVVHHIDEDPTNDAFSNLRLMSNSEHMILHNSGENNCNLGKPRSEETKAKISAATRKQWKDPEFRAKISAAMTGENNPNWKGDDASPSAKYYRILRAQRRCNASSAGRKPQTGADIPPFTRSTTGPRLTKKQKGPHFDMPSKSGSNPSVSPYPPVRYKWEAED